MRTTTSRAAQQVKSERIKVSLYKAGDVSADILQIAGLLGAILPPFRARCNGIRLAADYAGNQIAGLAASKGWSSSPDFR